MNPDDVCECGCPRSLHALGFLGCQHVSLTSRCWSCWWFRLGRAAGGLGPFAASRKSKWRLVRFECGCTRYVSLELVEAGLDDVYCAILEHADSHGVEVVG